MRVDLPLLGLVVRAWERGPGRSPDLWERLREEYLLEDWGQEARAIALEALLIFGNPRRDPEACREILRFASRRWHAFLRAYGLRRPRGARTYVRYEVLALDDPRGWNPSASEEEESLYIDPSEVIV